MGSKDNSWDGFFEDIKDRLKDHGIDLGDLDCMTDFDMSNMKVVCIPPGLSDSVREMGRSIRDKVVMVRIDDESSKSLDDWVEAGAVKSRSEAAALFIREGLKVRASELEKLQGALKDVEAAKERLREQARGIFGQETGSDGEEDEKEKQRES